MSQWNYGGMTGGGTGGDTDYSQLVDKELFMKFVGFKREDGQIWRQPRIEWEYEERGGKVFKKGEATPVPAAAAAGLYHDEVRMLFDIVFPIEFNGIRVSQTASVKGIDIGADGLSFSFITKGNRVGKLMRTLVACGLNSSKGDPESSLYDPDYVMGRVEKYCNAPLDVYQLLEYVFEDICKAEADRGFLVKAHTNKTNSFFIWDSFEAVRDADAQAMWAAVAKAGLVATPSEDLAPMPEDDGVDYDKIAAEVKAAVFAENDQGILIGDVQARMAAIYNAILEREPNFDKGPNMLSRCLPTSLAHVHSKIFPEQTEATVSL